MASLYIDFGYDDNVKRSINGAKSAIASRIDDYDGISRKVSNTDGSDYLSTANTYIRKKRNKLQDKWDKLDSFRTQIANFNEDANSADKRVANRIKTETNNFYKRENIPHGLLYTIGSTLAEGYEWLKGNLEKIWDGICTAAKAAWEWAKEFYEKHKYLIDLLVDIVIVVAEVVALVAAIATGAGVLAIVFGVWSVATSLADTVFDAAALGYHIAGDDETAEELSKQGMKEVMGYYLGDTGEMIYYGMEIASTVYDIKEFGESLYKAKTKMEVLERVKKYGTPEQISSIKKRTIKKVIFDTIGWGSGSSAADKMKNVKFVAKTYQTWSSDGSTGKKILKTFSISGKFVSLVDNTIDFGKLTIDNLTDAIKSIPKPEPIPRIPSFQPVMVGA